MSEEDLVENGYPRQCPSAPGKAVFKSRKEQPSKDCKLLHSWSSGIYTYNFYLHTIKISKITSFGVEY